MQGYVTSDKVSYVYAANPSLSQRTCWWLLKSPSPGFQRSATCIDEIDIGGELSDIHEHLVG